MSINKSVYTKLIRISRDLIEIPDANNKHFSFIMDGKRILSIGWNSYSKTHPLAKKYEYQNNNMHSELDAIVKFPGKYGSLSNYDIVNVRLNKSGEVRMSKPCPGCFKLIHAFKLRRCYYSTESGFRML